jgi:quercetin dioxygenase-like cupin family protein
MLLNVGDTLMEDPGRVHAAGNSGSTNTRLLVTVLLPKGVAFSTIQGSGETTNLPPGPTMVAQATFETPQTTATFDVVQRGIDLPAGASIAPHSHPGPNFTMLVQGQATLSIQGTTTNFKAGESWAEPPNVVHSGSNAGATTTRAVSVALVPRGAPATTPAQEPGPTQPTSTPTPAPVRATAPPAQLPAQLPRTGDLPIPGNSVALIGIGLLLGGVMARGLRRESR